MRVRLPWVDNQKVGCMKARNIIASTACFEIHNDLAASHPMTYAENMAQAERYLTLAGEAHSDIMLLPEVFAIKGVAEWFTWDMARNLAKVAESIPDGKSLQLVRKYAQKCHMYVIAPILECDGGALFNTTVVIDRQGAVVGKYRKTHLPESETVFTTPGDTLPVFKLDFGVIGISTCYDLVFGDVCRTLALKGAEIIFWPTMWSSPAAHEGLSELLMRGTALSNCVFLVSANYAKTVYDPVVRAGQSALISPMGEVLANTGFEPGFISAELCLEKLTFRCDNGAPCPYSVRRDEICSHRRPELYSR